MRLAKGFIFAIAGLFIVVSLVSLLMPSKVMTVRTEIIHTDERTALASIADLQTWKQWHPVFMKESSLRLSKPSVGARAFAEWKTNGKTNKLLLTEVSGNYIKFSLQRTNENPIENIISVKSLSDSNNVEVEWRVLTKIKWYPWEKFAGIFLDKMTGPGYEMALHNLKLLLEK